MGRPRSYATDDPAEYEARKKEAKNKRQRAYAWNRASTTAVAHSLPTPDDVQEPTPVSTHHLRTDVLDGGRTSAREYTKPPPLLRAVYPVPSVQNPEQTGGDRAVQGQTRAFSSLPIRVVPRSNMTWNSGKLSEDAQETEKERKAKERAELAALKILPALAAVKKAAKKAEVSQQPAGAATSTRSRQGKVESSQKTHTDVERPRKVAKPIPAKQPEVIDLTSSPIQKKQRLSASSDKSIKTTSQPTTKDMSKHQTPPYSVVGERPRRAAGSQNTMIEPPVTPKHSPETAEWMSILRQHSQRSSSLVRATELMRFMENYQEDPVTGGLGVRMGDRIGPPEDSAARLEDGSSDFSELLEEVEQCLMSIADEDKASRQAQTHDRGQSQSFTPPNHPELHENPAMAMASTPRHPRPVASPTEAGPSQISEFDVARRRMAQMGYTGNAAAEALRKHQGNLDAAVNSLYDAQRTSSVERLHVDPTDIANTSSPSVQGKGKGRRYSYTLSGGPGQSSAHGIQETSPPMQDATGRTSMDQVRNISTPPSSKRKTVHDTQRWDEDFTVNEGQADDIPSSPLPTLSELRAAPRRTNVSKTSPLPSQVPLPPSPEQEAHGALDGAYGSDSEPDSEPSSDEATDSEDEVPGIHLLDHLVEQLLSFHGCTPEAHAKWDREHARQQEEDPSLGGCQSIAELTAIIAGTTNADSQPLPYVLDRKIPKVQVMPTTNLKSIFEGTEGPQAGQHKSAMGGVESAATPAQDSRPHLCLGTHHRAEEGPQPEVSFDIDSACVFPNSLGIAKNGILFNWTANEVSNLKADIHFSLQIHIDDEVTATNVPLHHVPHYQLGTLANADSLEMFIFFPRLYIKNQNNDFRHSFISDDNLNMWFREVLRPCLDRVITSSNLKAHLGASYEDDKARSKAKSMESYAKKRQRSDNPRKQILANVIQNEYLAPCWDLISQQLKTAKEEGLETAKFADATLFLANKNTKTQYMSVSRDGDISQSFQLACEKWYTMWDNATDIGRDEPHYDWDKVYVDIAKQTTGRDSSIAAGTEGTPEVYLWRRCCLASYVKIRTRKCWPMNLSKKQRKKRFNCPQAPKAQYYRWATVRDARGVTIASLPFSEHYNQGLIYSQFYSNIKAPFDAAKTYPFTNTQLESLALDPGYVETLQGVGKAKSFSYKTCMDSYEHSKERCHIAIRDSSKKSFGVREEHRVSLAALTTIREKMMQRTLQQSALQQSTTAQPSVEEQRPLPYYRVLSSDTFAFLKAQINRFCWLFDHIQSGLGPIYSLSETVVMITALRSVQFAYGGQLLSKEAFLMKDSWYNQHDAGQQHVEGLGLQETIAEYGFGWIKPKFDWEAVRPLPTHLPNFMAGALALSKEYRKNWKAVKDLRNVYLRHSQAHEWIRKHNLARTFRKGAEVFGEPDNVKCYLASVILNYFTALVFNEFQAYTRKEMQRVCGKNELKPESTVDGALNDMHFTYNSMKRHYKQVGSDPGPKLGTGNKCQWTRAWELVNFLFDWEVHKFVDWENKGPPWVRASYRLIFRRAYESIESSFDTRRANEWKHDFLCTILLTHPILPWATNKQFISTSKTAGTQKMQGIWFSSMFEQWRDLEYMVSGPRSLSEFHQDFLYLVPDMENDLDMVPEMDEEFDFNCPTQEQADCQRGVWKGSDGKNKTAVVFSVTTPSRGQTWLRFQRESKRQNTGTDYAKVYDRLLEPPLLPWAVAINNLGHDELEQFIVDRVREAEDLNSQFGIRSRAGKEL